MVKVWRHVERRSIDPARPLHAAEADAVLLLVLALRDSLTRLRASRAVARRPAPPISAGSKARRVRSVTLSVAAVLLVWVALLVPSRLEQVTPAALLRIPIELIAILLFAVALPRRVARIVSIVIGALAGVLVLVDVLDAAFFETLHRRFDPVTDWGYAGSAVGVLTDSVGPAWAVLAAIGAVLGAVVVLALVTASTMRTTALAARRRPVAVAAVAVLASGWATSAAFGIHAPAGGPIAASDASGLAVGEVTNISHSIRAAAAFDRHLSARDPVVAGPAKDLVAGLRGKDVIVAFVESYGRSAVEGSSFSPGVDSALRAGTRSLAAAGYSSRSAFLTSPTFGGISWLAHSTLQSGLWIDSQQRYDQLLAGHRTTLTSAFSDAGWRTVSDVPSDTRPWPEGKAFYGFDRLYDAGDVGYAGPRFSYSRIPDQWTLAKFQQNELQPGHAPVMAEIDLVSSHTPWTPLPRRVDPARLGDGSVYDGMPAQGLPPDVAWRDPATVRSLYGRSVQYSLGALVDFVTSSHDKNLVLLLLGDHQPARIVSGASADHDVPITLVAHDPAVLRRIAGWRWTPGMLPAHSAPTWRMDSFRDRFFAAFGSVR